MDKYIIFGNVFGIGGWQIYLEGRILHLTNRGIKVFVVSPSIKNEVIQLEYVHRASVLSLDATFRTPAIFTKSQKRRILKRVLDFIDYSNDDSIFVESTSIFSSLWGEMIAKKTLGKHFSFILNSHVGDVIGNNGNIKDFFSFKYSQKLLAGMTPLTLKEMIFNNSEVDNDMLYSFKAAGRDPLTFSKCDFKEVPIIKTQKANGSFVVGYFGNLDKPHVPVLVSDLCSYFKARPNGNFLFLTIGSSTTKKIEKNILREISKLGNARSINIPDVFPVPAELFNLMDVCIGSWGSARVASRSGVKTIRLTNDTEAIPQGIIGVTLRGAECYNLPCGNESLTQYLDGILFENKYVAISSDTSESYPDYEIIQSDIDHFVAPMFYSRQKTYYNVDRIKAESLRSKLMRLCTVLFGVKVSNFLFRSLKN